MSYLDPLRLHFAGRFQAAPSTVNNDIKNYDNAHFKPEGQQGGWNPRGDADWRLIGCRVTAASHADGQSAGDDDLILTCLVADSDRQVAAKIVDLDPQQQFVSALWGFEVRICDAQGETLLRGKYETASFVDLWGRALGGGSGDIVSGAMYQSVLSELEWGQTDRSPFLTELRHAARNRLLSIKFNVDGYNMDPQSPEFTRGRIVGTIGPATVDEPQHFVRGRQLMPVGARNAQVRGKINSCVAIVDQHAGKIFLDLGNALPTTLPGGPPANQGELSLACLLPQGPTQELSLGSISYTEAGWYEKTAGIVTLPADRRLTNEELNAIATHPLALLLPGADNRPAPVASEALGGLYVRADQFVFCLNPGEQAKVRLIATRYGQPYPGAQILLTFDPSHLQSGQGEPEPALPVDAVDYPPGVVAGPDGVATVMIRAHNPRNPRGYVDGQVYGVRPILEEFLAFRGNYPFNPSDFISLLILDDFSADEPPTWWGSLQPIFQQYANLYPIMNTFLDLADYESVCAHAELLQLAFSLEPENPNAMPVTRNLSAAKREAILRWLRETGPDGKPLLGLPPSTGMAQAAKPTMTVSPPIQDTQGGKASAASRRLALRPFPDQP